MIDVQLRGLIVAGQVVLGAMIYSPATCYLYAFSVEEQAQFRWDFGWWGGVQRTSKPSRSLLALWKSVSTFSTEAC